MLAPAPRRSEVQWTVDILTISHPLTAECKPIAEIPSLRVIE